MLETFTAVSLEVMEKTSCVPDPLVSFGHILISERNPMAGWDDKGCKHHLLDPLSRDESAGVDAQEAILGT